MYGMGRKPRSWPLVVISVANPRSGIQCLFDPWIRDEQPGSYFRELRNNTWYLNSFIRIRDGKKLFRDPGWKKFGSGINIPDPQTLFFIGSYLPSPPCYCSKNGYQTSHSPSLPALCASGTVTGVGGDSFNQGAFTVVFSFLFCTPLLCLDLALVRYSEFFWSNPQLPYTAR